MAGQPVDLGHSDAQQLLQQISLQGVAGLIQAQVNKGLVSGLTKAQAESLQLLAHQQLAIEMVLNDEASRFVALLEEHGFEFLLLKGTAVAHLHYAHPWQRPRSDVDVWIRETEATAVAETLSKAGYQVVNLEHNAVSSRQFQAKRRSFQGRDIWFDIHLRISNRGLFQHALDFDDCLSCAQVLPAQNGPGLSNHHLLIHAALHRVAHERNRYQDRLIWLWDIHLLYRQMDAEERTLLVNAALAAQQGVIVAAALEACRNWFGTELAPNDLDRLTSQANEEPSAKLIQSGRLAWVWSDVVAQDNWRDRFQLCSEIVKNRIGALRSR